MKVCMRVCVRVRVLEANVGGAGRECAVQSMETLRPGH